MVEGGRLGLRATLIEDGANFPGTLELLDNLGKVVIESGEIEGTVDSGNSFILSGVTSRVDPSESGSSTLREWTSTLTGDGAGMVGSFTRMSTFRNFWGDQQMRYRCQLEAFQRSNP
jgi:hypothetical protein